MAFCIQPSAKSISRENVASFAAASPVLKRSNYFFFFAIVHYEGKELWVLHLSTMKGKSFGCCT